eukprot:TRINITY_DN300_c12_g1_i1.p1 TRINITY_DN300_c12_g1~~TRINITY_DN300_c12_g1_i1.p1  ORF type:complete len:393 (+),score=146.84 TRINITY_DN300_c12_g1_i1:57-1181(+)
MPVDVKRNIRDGEKLENKVFGHYKGIREEMEAADASLLSCNQIYTAECQRIGIKPNPRIMDQLPKTPGKYAMHELNAGCNYIGDKGLQALLPVIEVNKGLRKLKISENGIKNDSGVPLVHLLRRNKHVISLDLSGNKGVALEVGTACLQLVKENIDFMHLSLSKTSVSRQLQESIEKQLKLNRKKNGERNRRLLQERKRIERHQFFEMKATYDELDVDRSGSVSVKELHALSQKKQLAGDAKHIDLLHQAAIFEQLDRNGDGEVTLTEYIMAAFPGICREDLMHCIDCFSEFSYPEYVPSPELSTEQIEEISAIFGLYDKNKDGKLTLAELKAGLNASAMCVDVAGYFKTYDTSNDGLLELPEFIDLMTEYYIG